MCCCITLLMLLFHSSHVDASFFMCCYLDSSSIATSNILALLPHSFFTLFLLSFCACAFVFIMLLLLLFFLRCYFILFTIQVHTDPSRSCFFRNITFVFFALFCSCFFRWYGTSLPFLVICKLKLEAWCSNTKGAFFSFFWFFHFFHSFCVVFQ